MKLAFLFIAIAIATVVKLYFFPTAANNQPTSYSAIPTLPATSPTLRPAANTVMYSPKKDIKITIPENAYPEALTYKASESLASANIPNHISFRSIGFWGFTKDNKPISIVEKAVTFEFVIPQSFKSFNKEANKDFVYTIENPVAFFYDTKVGWKKVPSEWNATTRKMSISTNEIGSFAWAIPVTPVP